MGSFGDYLENKILDHIFGMGARNYVPPANIFIALSTDDPTDSGAGLAEPVGGSYARVSTVAADWAVAAGGEVSNVNPIEFPEATGDWGDITHFALFDQAVGGNLLAHGALTVHKVIGIGDTARFKAGDLDVTLD
jgi:hypothetical protein